MHIFRTVICIITLVESVQAGFFPRGAKITNPTCNDDIFRGLMRDEKKSNRSREGNTRGLKKSKGTEYNLHKSKSKSKGTKSNMEKSLKRTPRSNSRKVVETTDLGSLVLDWGDWGYCNYPLLDEDIGCPSQDGVPEGWVFFHAIEVYEVNIRRNCTIKNNKMILLPMVFGFPSSEDVDCKGLNLQDEQCADAVKATCDEYMTDDLITAAASLNGSPIAFHTISTPVVRKFESNLCENHELEGKEFVYGCGYWVVLPPLCTCTEDEPYKLYTNWSFFDYAGSVTHSITVTGD